MKKSLILSLAAVLLVAAITGCSKGQAAPLTPEERTELYQTAIESARDQETNDAIPAITSSEDNSGLSDIILPMLGVTEEDMSAYAIAVSPVNIRAYGVAAIFPASGKEDTVLEGLNGFIDLQKQNFERYLEDQYEIASNAKLETLEDGTLLLVMCSDQDAVFDAIKGSIEAGQSA